MEEIKLRVFSKGVMTYNIPDHWIFLKDGKLETIQDNMEIMQFTGHFATGQELYDGDIITHPEADFPVRVYQGLFGEWLTEGETDSYGGTLEEWSPDECTIVGDIHTTPELLEGSLMKLNIKQEKKNNIFCYRCGKDHANADFKDVGSEIDKGEYKLKEIECSICNTKRTLTMRK